MTGGRGGGRGHQAPGHALGRGSTFLAFTLLQQPSVFRFQLSVTITVRPNLVIGNFIKVFNYVCYSIQ